MVYTKANGHRILGKRKESFIPDQRMISIENDA